MFVWRLFVHSFIFWKEAGSIALKVIVSLLGGIFMHDHKMVV
jgi:hypothetical protein